MSNLPLCQGNVCPSCSPDEFDIPLESFIDLFTHAARLAHDIHNFSTIMFREFNLQYAQGKHYHINATKSCHTNSLETPEEKVQAQKKNNEELGKWILMILYSWKSPLYHLIFEVLSLKEVAEGILSIILENEKKMQELQEFIERQFSQVAFAAIRKIYKTRSYWLRLPFLKSIDEDTRHAEFYNLFQCLSRDLRKVDIYTKIMACRLRKTC